MTITVYAGDVPNRSTQTQAEFSANVDTFLTWLNGVVPEFNALAVGSATTGIYNAVEISSDGSSAAPVFRFASEPATGLYRISAANIGLAISGSLRYTFGNTTFAFTGSDITVGGKSVYTKTSVVGTVSFTSENTGAVIETGNNANGTYTKFADGTMIARHNIGANNAADSTWTFPAAFIAAPDCVGSAEATFSNPRIFMSAGQTASALTFNVINLSSARTTSRAYMVAYGRWRT